MVGAWSLSALLIGRVAGPPAEETPPTAVEAPASAEPSTVPEAPASSEPSATVEVPASAEPSAAVETSASAEPSAAVETSASAESSASPAVETAASDPPSPSPAVELCAATPMWDELVPQVPVNDETRRLRARLNHGRGLARQADAESDALAAARLCLESVVDYGEVVAEALGGGERASAERRRADDAAAELRRRIDALEAALPPPPPPSPEEAWTRRHRRLVAETSVSGFFATAGLLMVTIPWAYIVACPEPQPAFGCGEGLGAVVLTGVGLPISVSGGIWFAVSATRLIKHRHARPPALVVGRGRWRMRWGAPRFASFAHLR